MVKSAEAFRTISEVADWLDTPTHVLRFWESKFSQIKPLKRAGGRRYYRPQDMLLIGGIKKLLHSDGLTIKGAQNILREQGQKYVCNLSKPLDGGKNLHKTLHKTQVDETREVEIDASLKEPSWKPMGITAMATDLGEDGQIIEPNPAERDLPDLAMEQLDALWKPSVEESAGSESVNIVKTTEASGSPRYVAGEVVSDLDQEVMRDFANPTPDIPSASPGKTKLASKKEMKKSLDLLDDDQPMLNFWASDDQELEAESIHSTKEAIDQEIAFPAAEDLKPLNEMANYAKTVPVYELPQKDKRNIDQAEPQQVEQDVESETVEINAPDQGEVLSVLANSAELAHGNSKVTMDIAAGNANSAEDTTAQTPVEATLRSIEDHLAGQPIVSSLKAKALRTGLIALEDAIEKRRGTVSKG